MHLVTMCSSHLSFRNYHHPLNMNSEHSTFWESLVGNGFLQNEISQEGKAERDIVRCNEGEIFVISEC